MDNVKIKVSFYNTEEKEKFKKNYPQEFKLLDKIDGTTIEVPVEDFRTYFLFRHQDGRVGFRRFKDFFKKLSTRWGYLIDYYKYTKSSKKFSALVADNGGNNEVSEGLGVAGGLVVASKVFLNTTQADWRKIPVLQTTDFDFAHIASDGKKYIIVECKGSIVSNNERLAEISGHKGGIIEKKANKDFKSKYSRKTYFYFGTITSADETHDLNVRLVDPPANDIQMDPRKYKLLSRLYYYYDVLSAISQRSFITLSLANRIKVITEIKLHDQLDGIALVDNYIHHLSLNSNFIFTKTRDKNSLVGTSKLTDEGDLFFIGLHLTTLELLINQDFNSILTFIVKEPSTYNYGVTIVLNQSKEDERKFMETYLPDVKPKAGLYQIERKMSLSIGSSGIIYGRLSRQELIKQ